MRTETVLDLIIEARAKSDGRQDGRKPSCYEILDALAHDVARVLAPSDTAESEALSLLHSLANYSTQAWADNPAQQIAAYAIEARAIIARTNGRG